MRASSVGPLSLSFSLSHVSAYSCFGMPPLLQQEESDSISSPWPRTDSTGKFSRAEEGKTRRESSPWKERGRERKCERERTKCAEGRERRKHIVVVTSRKMPQLVLRATTTA